MAILTASELSAMRDHLEAHLPDTCEIDSMARTSDGAGGWTEAWTARGTAIPCRMAHVITQRFQGVTLSQMREGYTWMLTVAHDQTVALTDRVIHKGLTYQVVQINTSDSELVGTRVELQRAA
jgi:hypothetical protein